MPKVGRNDPCPCGSGKKYKACCLHKEGTLQGFVQNKFRGWQADYFQLGLILVIIAVTTLAYWNSFTVPFVFDDGSNIIHNTGIHLRNFTPESVATLKDTVTKQGRAITLISFALNYYFGALNTFGYHLFNLILHILVSILIFYFVRLTLNLPGFSSQYGKWAKETAAGCALIFAVHPVNTQAVTYIVQRYTGMAAGFALCSLIFYAKARLRTGSGRAGYFMLSIICFLLAFNSKQNMVVLPILVGIYEFYAFQKQDVGWLKRHWMFIALAIILPFLAALIYTKFDLLGWFVKEYARREFTMGQRLLTEMRVLVYYLTLLVLPLPSRLNLDYTGFPLSYSLISPQATLYAMLFLAGLLVLAVVLYRRQPLISFCILWYFVNLMVESSIVALDLIYDHRLYFPIIGLLIPVVFGGVKLINRSFTKGAKAVETVVLGVLVVLAGFGVHQRNETWQSVISILEDVVKKAPNNSRQHVNLGVAYSDIGEIDKAIVLYKKGIEIKDDYAETYNNLGNAYNRKGMYKKAIVEYQKAIKLKHDYKEAHNNLGSAYSNLRQYDKAIAEHKKALKINPNCEKSHNNLGVAYSFKREYDKAVREYKRALEIAPSFTRSRVNLALAYSYKRMYALAIAEFKKVLKREPNKISVLYNLGNVYSDAGQYEQAAAIFSRIVQAKPDYAEARNNLGLAYKSMGQYDKAEIEFKKALGLQSNRPELYFNLGLIYRDSGRGKQAEEAFKKALAKQPNLTMARLHLGRLYESQGRQGEAYREYQRAVKYNPNNAQAYRALGIINLNTFGNPRKARKYLIKSLNLNPNQPDAEGLRQILRRIEQQTL